MLILRLCFIFYFLKLSVANGFWSNLNNTNVNVHRAAKLYQKSLQKCMQLILNNSLVFFIF